MKKILIGMICDGNAGGVDKYILRFYNSLKDNNYKIDFLTNSKDKALEKELNSQGSQLFEVAGLTHPIKQYKQAKEIIKIGSYDVVYMNISTALSFPVLKAAYDLKVKKVIAHSHSSAYDCNNTLKRKIFTFLHKLCKGFVCKYANTFVTCSDKAALWMFDKKTNTQKEIITVYNCVDKSKFAPNTKKREAIRKELGLEDKFIIGFVGNILYQKNPSFLIDIFAAAKKEIKNAHLLIIGDGPLKNTIKEKIAALGLKKDVTMLGRIKIEGGYYDAFDVFVLPSVFEGLPTVMVEAQMNNTPCVVSDKITHMSKIINACDFVSINSVDAWVEKLKDYVDFNKESIIFNNNAANFDEQKQIKTFLKVAGE